MLWNKNLYTYSKKDNLLDTDFFVSVLNKLKTYSKCINASGYSVTNTLEDVYSVLKYQHAFWITLTNIAPDSLELEGLVLEKGIYYNLTKDLTDDQILNSTTLRSYIEQGLVKAANSELFEDFGASDFFTVYEPTVITFYGTNGTNAPVVNSTTSGIVIQGTNFIDNTISTEIVWNYGTFGTAFIDILINSNYTINDWKDHFQTSFVEGEFGYTQQNLFTSQKVLTKLLKNFNLVDLASTGGNVDISIKHPLLNIDGIGAVDGHKILLKDQNNPVENGVYLYTKQFLVLDDSFNTETDFYLYSAYIKVGNTNAGKQFFLDREADGSFPLITDPKFFIEGTNFIVRNRLSYILLQNHSFSDVKYFTQNEPNISFDYTDKIYGTNGSDFYQVNQFQKSLDYTNGTNFIKYSPLTNITFLKELQELNSSIYLVGKEDNNFNLYKAEIQTPIIAGTNGTNLIYNYFQEICPLSSTVIDFQLLNTTQGLFLNSNVVLDGTNSITYTNIEGITFNSTSFLNISLPNATDFEYITLSGQKFYFYLTNNNVSVNYLGVSYNIKDILNPTQLRVKTVTSGTNSEVEISYLVNDIPQVYCIEVDKFFSLLGWTKDIDYELDFFSKESIDVWNISNQNLFLKDVQITNLSNNATSGTGFNLQVPKISNGNFRTYDGIDDYSNLINSPIVQVQSNGSFTIEFKITPNQIRTQMPVFYFGEIAQIASYELLNVTYTYSLPVYKYISFILSDTDGFPYFILSESSTKFVKIKANRVINVGKDLDVAFTWQYTTNKATGRLYFKEEGLDTSSVLVGSIVDLRTFNNVVNNAPLNIQNITFDSCQLAKSQLTYPNYNGNISEFRIWNKDLNPSQINSRAGKEVLISDVLYSELVGYWKLNDQNSYHLEQISKNLDSTFFGGLNRDIVLPTIQSVNQIQLSSDSLFILEHNNNYGTNGLRDIIYRINLLDESISIIHHTTNIIISIYVEKDILYYLENNKIYFFNSDFTTSLLLNGTGTILDFTIVEGNPYTYKNDNNIYDGSNFNIFNNTFGSIKYIYGKKQIDTVPNLLNIYLSQSNGNINLLSDSYNDVGTTSSLILQYIATYPLASNNTVINGTNSYSLSNNIISYGSNVLDTNNEFWNKNLKTIQGIFNRQNNILVLVTTLLNDVQVWQYTPSTNTYIRLIDVNGNATLVNTSSNVDLTYQVINNEEFIILMNSDSKTVTWFKLEKGNKFSWTTLSWSKSWISNTISLNIDVLNNSKLTLFSENGTQKYLSLLKNSTPSYDLWRDCLTYQQITNGWIVGDTGIIFKDASSTSWNIELSNIVYKNNFSAMETFIEKSKRDLGYSVSSWSGIVWLIGKNGLIIKTLDNGITWKVLETGVNQNLNSISFIDDKVGLVVGDNGIILSSFTGGDSFELVTIPQDVTFRDWTKVLIYSPTSAIIIGNGGTMLHLTLVNNNWIVNRILNNTDLTNFDKQIIDSDLDNSIKINFKTEFDQDQYNQTLRDIKYLGNNKFLICGDKDLVAHIELLPQLTYIQPTINIFKTNLGLDWDKISLYLDIAENKNKAFLSSNDLVYTFTYEDFIISNTTNISNTTLSLFYDNNKVDLNSMTVDNEFLYAVGDRVNVVRKDLFILTNGTNGTSGIGGLYFYEENPSVFEKQDLRSDFKPKMLFLDYYLGRKINLHLEDGSFETPSTQIPKNLLSCFYFNTGDYIEFSDYGTVNKQNNFLAFQDYFYLNRRVLDGGLDKFAKMEPWIKYNKRLTAVTPLKYDSDYLWLGTFQEDLFTSSTSGYLSNGTNGTNFFRLINDQVNSTSGFTSITGSYNNSALREDSLSTKIQIDSFTIKANLGDVIKCTLTKTDKTILLQNGMSLYFKVSTPVILFNLDTYATIDDSGILKVGYLDFIDTNALTTKDVNTLQNYVQGLILTVVNNYYNSLSQSIITLNSIIIDVAILIIDTNFIVRDYNNVNQTITVWDLLDQDIIEDARYGSKLVIQNLNYFDSSLLHLEKVFNQHYLRQSYVLDVHKPDTIYISGEVNDYTKYYNLESILSTSINGTSFTYPIEYSEDVVYGPKYDLVTFLQNIDTVFTDSYSFDLPTHNFTYNNLTKTSNGNFTEFTITGNKIYIGNDLTQALDFKPGTYLNITRGLDTVFRTYLSKIEVISYSKYPDKKRYVLHFDTELALNLQDSNTTVTLRTRNTLKEISQDLEFTDDLMFPLPNDGTNGVEFFNKAYFNQTKTAAAYAPHILNDVNIRKTISSVVYLDTEGDWNINIIDWKQDPNLYYRPVDLHELGIDDVFKKAVSVDPINLAINSNRFVLQNIDLNKYNFKLVDGLTLKSLEAKYYWILNADIRNAIIGEDSNGLVWYMGDFLCGTWEGSKFYSGRVFNIEWIKGDFYSYIVKESSNIMQVFPDTNPNNSVWFQGTFNSGNFHNGLWMNGILSSGNIYNIIWYNGLFVNGTWHSGQFMGGQWMNGLWMNGSFFESTFPSIWNDGTFLGGDFDGKWLNGVFDQAANSKSRFGTKATLLHPSIWEYGLWKNGEFHSVLTIDSNGNSIASINYSNSVWLNGIWEKGSFFGGTIKYGSFTNITFINGYFRSDMDIESINSIVGGLAEIKFVKPHYFKNINNITNIITIIGKPEIINGNIDNNTIDLGYNTKPVKHEIIEIIDDFTISIKSNISAFRINSFDYVIIRYKDIDFTNGTNGGTEIEIRTAIIDLPGSGTNFNGLDVGNYRNTVVGNNYLRWGGNNTSPTGSEAVLVNFKQMVNDFYSTINPLESPIITTRLKAYWFNSVLSGNLEIEFEAYKGGTMSSSGNDFFNIGGTLVNNLTVNRNTLLTMGSNINGDDMGTLVYDVRSNTATIEPPLSSTSIPVGCVDYTLENSVSFTKESVPLTDLGYLEGPYVVSNFTSGSFFAGIFENGLFLNSFWKGGIFLGGVADNNQFDS